MAPPCPFYRTGVDGFVSEGSTRRAGGQAIGLVLCGHPTPTSAHGLGHLLTPRSLCLCSPLSLRLISRPFQTGSCCFHSLPSLAFSYVSPSVPSPSLLPSSPQLSKEGKEKHLQGLDRERGKKLNKIGESDFHQYHRKCPNPFSENLLHVPG